MNRNAGELKAGLDGLQAVEVDSSLFGRASGKVAVDLGLLEHLATTPADVFIPKLASDRQSVEFLRVLKAGSPNCGRMVRAVRSRGMQEVYVGTADLDLIIKLNQQSFTDLVSDVKASARAKGKALHQNAGLLAQQAFNQGQARQAVRNAGPFLSSAVSCVKNTPGASQALARMMTIDYSLFTHSVNVFILAVTFGSHLGMPGHELEDLGMGALFHDLGKVRVEELILKKKGPLSDQEWDVMRQHPEWGYEILSEYPEFPETCLEVVIHHHEAMDGSGYPHGIAGAQIPMHSQVIKILDCYDAITSRRWYKGALPAFEAIRIMHQQMPRQLANDLFVRFISFLGELGDSIGQDSEADASGGPMAIFAGPARRQ